MVYILTIGSPLAGKLNPGLRVKLEILDPMTLDYVELWNGRSLH